MTKRFPPGKVPWDKIEEKVRSKLPSEVILGPALGEDAALVKIGGEIWAVACDPITFTSKGAGRLSVIVNANDIVVRGAVPIYYIVAVLVSPDAADEERVASLLDEIRTACEDFGVALIGGHTEVSPGLPNTIVVGTMLGKVARRPITTGGLREGDLIGITKWAGLEGTSILLNEFGSRLREIHGPAAFAEAEGIFGSDWLSIVPEATLAATCPHVTALHDVTEGGVGEALYEMAKASGKHVRVDAGRIPILSVTRLMCCDLGMNPFGLIGSGSLLVGCAKEGKEELERVLAGRGIPFTWIGEAGAPKDDLPAALPRFERDEILKARLLDGVQACVFDMDGTIIDSEYDWLSIRAALGVNGVSIVDDLNSLEGEEKERRWAKLREIEREATLAAQLKPGVRELLDLLAQKEIKTALVTNNSDANVSYLLEKFDLAFDAVVTRDSGLYKPSGAPVAEAVRLLGAAPERTFCVGDSLYDILACRDAGCSWVCILFDAKNRVSSQADLSFPDIAGLIRYLQILL